MTITKRNRFRAVLVGVHCGDSAGAPYETWDPKRIKEDIVPERNSLTDL